MLIFSYYWITVTVTINWNYTAHYAQPQLTLCYVHNWVGWSTPEVTNWNLYSNW